MDAATETPVVADAAVVQRKRGRPKKTDAPVAKKVLKSTTGNAAKETTGEKIERRGRPKGVKNSPKAAPKVAKEKAPKEKKAPKKEKVSAPVTGEKRKRGRPAKVDKEAAVEKPAKKAKTAAVGKKTKTKPATEDEVEEQVDGVEDAVEAAVEKPAKKAKTAAVGKKTKTKPATEDEVEEQVEDAVEDAVEEKQAGVENDGSIPAKAASNNTADADAPSKDESSVQEDVTLS